MNKQQLIDNIRRKQTFLCIGLDTDIKKIPQHLLQEEDPVFAFNRAIIDATADLCIAYKPNLAFYECLGVKGWQALEKTVKYIRQNYPDQFIIADAKRGDIGNTSAMYARSFFEDLQVDAVTVAPYMGEDSVTPFLGYEGKWVILLALTSNKGSHDFQLTEDAQGERLFEKVLRKSQEWAGDDQMMYVVGATQGRMFEDIRKVVPGHFLLVPGVGAQGGSLEEVWPFLCRDWTSLPSILRPPPGSAPPSARRVSAWCAVAGWLRRARGWCAPKAIITVTGTRRYMESARAIRQMRRSSPKSGPKYPPTWQSAPCSWPTTPLSTWGASATRWSCMAWPSRTSPTIARCVPRGNCMTSAATSWTTCASSSTYPAAGTTVQAPMPRCVRGCS